MSQPNLVIPDPAHVSTEQLKAFIKARNLLIPNLDWMSRAETLQIYRKYAQPRPQRTAAGILDHPPGCDNAAAATSATCTSASGKRRSGDDGGAGIERVTIDCKRIRITGNRGPGGKEQQVAMMMEMETDADESPVRCGRGRHKPITWP